MSKRIPLTQGKSALVDDCDYDNLRRWHWRYADGYALRDVWIDGQRKRVWMHRQVMNAKAGQLVDHIDTDRLNNTRANLRFVTGSQNQWNRQKNTQGSSPYKGVSYHRKGWHVRIRVYGKRIHLGYFDTPEQAAWIYDAAAYHFFGVEYARVNFPDTAVAPANQRLLENILDRKKAG